MKNKGFVYFFKHTLIDGVKIGFTKNNTVKSRFNQFKIYSPHGAEILGTIKTSNPKQLESEIHKKYAHKRMSGEFFSLSNQEVQIIIEKYNPDIEIYNIFKEWVCNEENNTESLKKILKKANIENNKKIDFIPLIHKYLKPGLKPITLNNIHKLIEIAEHPTKVNKYTLRKGLEIVFGKPKMCIENDKKGRYYYLSSNRVEL